MIKIDWSALGIVVWRFVKFMLILLAVCTTVALAITYLGPYSLLLVLAWLIFAYLRLEYKSEVLKRGGYIHSTWDSDR